MKPRLAVLDMIGTTVEAGPEVTEAFIEAFARKCQAPGTEGHGIPGGPEVPREGPPRGAHDAHAREA